MLKNKIYKYFTFEILKSFLTILFALSAVAWTVRAVNFLDLVVENGHSITTYLLFSLLNITNIITKFIPISFLLALVLTVLKLEKQNELIILWSAGVNKIKLVNLFFLLSVFILFIQLCFATYITPISLNKSRALIRTSDFNSMQTVIRINEFSDSVEDITFYVGKRNINNEMENIFIRDESHTFKDLVGDSKDAVNVTIIAKKGIINEKTIILENGLIQSQNKNKELNNVNFSRTILNLDAITPRGIIKPKLQETTTIDLLKCLIYKKSGSVGSEILNCPKNDVTKDVISTLLRRVGMPIYIPVIALTASFILVSRKDSKNKIIRNYFYFFLCFLILILAELLVRFSGFSNLHSLVYLFFPIILMPFVYLILYQKFKLEKKRI